MNTPRSKDSITHMNNMGAFLRGMQKSVSKSFETLPSIARNGTVTQVSKEPTLSPFSKNLKKRQSLYTMLSEEMGIKKMLVEIG